MSFVAVPASIDQDQAEIEALLHEVYVGGGFTDAQAAGRAFAAAAVFARGDVLIVRDPVTAALAGIVVVVPSTSHAARFAGPGEVELQLLAVAPSHRKQGVGDRLVGAAIDRGRALAAHTMILWTQAAMHSAQRLYARHGFMPCPARDFQAGTRTFVVFQRAL